MSEELRFPFGFSLSLHPRRNWIGLTVALVLTSLAVLLRFAIAPQDAGYPYVTFFPAAALTAVFAGFVPGLVTTALGTLAANYLFIDPLNDFSLTTEALGSALVFCADEVMVCGAIEAMHRFYRKYVEAVKVLDEARDSEQRAREMAERAVEARSRFFAAASHDLRQPLQALRLFVDLLATSTRGSGFERTVTLASRALDDAEALVRSHLDIARMNSGAVPITRTSVDLSLLFSQFHEEFAPYARDKGLRLIICPTRLVVQSDRNALARIIKNLIANAVHYTERGGVLVGCRRRGDKAVIEVWDTGIGVAKDKLTLIWEEFFQVDNPNRDRAQGLGLGLSIVKKLADALDCPVSVASVYGQGSVFRIAVPLAEPAVAVPKAAEPGTRQGVAFGGKGTPVRPANEDRAETARVLSGRASDEIRS